MASEIKVDTISEKTADNGVSIDGLKIKDVTSGSVMSKPILQVITGTTSTDTGATASTSFVDTGLSASITPSATSSKVLVIVSQTLQHQRSGDRAQGGYVNIMKDTTELAEYYFAFDEVSGENGPSIRTLQFMDAPNSTSSLTYKTQMRANTTSDGGTVRANQQSSSGQSISSIQLIEIAG